jgi:hypothetical protein
MAEADKSMLNIANAIESIFIDLDLMYSFRDNVLYNSEIGDRYVDDYYYLSYEFEGKVTLPLAIQTVLFFRDFNSVMEAFVNPANRQSEVMFTNTLTQSLLNLLNQYETITESAEGKEILKTIREDIQNFKGKTLQELLDLL